MNSEQFHIPSPLQKVPFSELNDKNIELYIKRDDLIHKDVSGNKWRKLRLNIEQARFKGKTTIITFGGAYSNHIAATAKACNIYGLNSIGIIRGEDADLNNQTLAFALQCGMKIIPSSRSEYRQKDTWDYRESLKEKFSDFYLVPEGGSNYYGVQGCMDIIKEVRSEIRPDAIFVSCGTGTTVSGMTLANSDDLNIYGVSALKGGSFLLDEVRTNLMDVYSDEETVQFAMRKTFILTDFHFGGYAKINSDLVDFMRSFYRETSVKLDPIYTAKTAFAMVKKAREKHNKNPEKWVLIHTGGLQGIPGMEEKLGHKFY